MTGAETRLLRFLQAAAAHQRWVPYTTICNTDDLLPGDEKALPALFARGLLDKRSVEPAYRLSAKGSKALGRSSSERCGKGRGALPG